MKEIADSHLEEMGKEKGVHFDIHSDRLYSLLNVRVNVNVAMVADVAAVCARDDEQSRSMVNRLAECHCLLQPQQLVAMHLQRYIHDVHHILFELHADVSLLLHVHEFHLPLIHFLIPLPNYHDEVQQSEAYVHEQLQSDDEL